jgi:hypothetical protein
MIYVYAIAEGVSSVGDLAGVQGEPIVAVQIGDASVLIGEVATRPSLDADALRAQDAVVRALHDRASALLPMRFGTTSADRDDLLKTMGGRADLMRRLAAVRGCEQMVVRVLGSEDETTEQAPAAASSGTEYLLARAKRRAPGPALDALAAGVAALAKEVRVEPAGQPGLIGSVYHLVERGRAGEYRDAIDRLAREMPDVRVLVSGPAPAYAFA